MPNERLETIRKHAPWLAYFHFAVMVYGAADDKPLIILLAIASLIIGNILGREPKKKKKPGDDQLIGRRLRHS